MIPENSYSHRCGCGREFLAPKGSLHCHACLYKYITELEEYKSGELARCAEQSEKESKYEGKLLDRIAELEQEIVADDLTIANNYDLMDASAKQIEELKTRLQRTNGELANTIHEVNYYKNREVSEDEVPDAWGFEVVFDNDMYLLEK